MATYYVIRTWHSRFLYADLPLGSVVSGEEAFMKSSRAGVLGIVPSNRSDLCLFAAHTFDNLPLMLAPDDYRNPLLPFGITRFVEDRQVAFFHLLTRRYVCAAPIELPNDSGTVTADRDIANDWECFMLTKIPENSVPPRVVASASALESVLGAGPQIEAVLGILEGVDLVVAKDVLHAYWPVLTLPELQHMGQDALNSPALSARLGALLPDDIWATDGLLGLADWIAWREPPVVAPTPPATLVQRLRRALFEQPMRRGKSSSSKMPRPSKRCIGLDLDFLADAGLRGTFASFGHMCNAYARAAVQPTRNVCIISTARNEGIYLLEWIAYHRAIGVEAFFLYSNDNNDGSDELLGALADAGVITWIDNQVSPGGSAQGKAYGHALSLLPDVLDYRWALIIDLDEFFVFNPNMFRSAQEFLRWQEMRTADAIAINWIFMGSDGEGVWRDAPVTKRFKRAVEPVNPHIKTACRPGMFIHSGPHFPKTDARRTFVYRHSAGDLHSYHNWLSRMPDHAPAFSDDPNASYAAIQHYFFKSAEEYLWKFSRNRGDLYRSEGLSTVGLEEHFVREFVAQHDREGGRELCRLERCVPDLNADVANLLSVPGVAAADTKIKTTYCAMIAKIKELFPSAPAILQAGEVGQRLLELAHQPDTEGAPDIRADSD